MSNYKSPDKDETSHQDSAPLASPTSSSPLDATCTLVPTSRITSGKCVKCKTRLAREGCIELSCFKCCQNLNCPGHKQAREQAAWKEKVVSGTTDVQKMAKELRSKQRLPPKRFKEPGFVYTGDTIVIWNLREYMKNPKWREDAVRKSVRRKDRHTATNFSAGKDSFQTHATNQRRPGGNSRRRFHRIIEELYRQSLERTNGKGTDISKKK